MNSKHHPDEKTEKLATEGFESVSISEVTWTERAHTPSWNPLGISLSVEARPEATRKLNVNATKHPIKFSVVSAVLVLLIIALTVTLIWI